MAKTLRLIARAWGRRQEGYVFFPWIDRDEQVRAGSRRAGYYEGPDPENPAFEWPQDREKIIDHMMEHQDHDLYWCPSIFEYPHRREDLAADEHALWADLDEVHPEAIEDYPPTMAWETSPGRYQALWLASTGDFQGASWPGNENQRLTYHLGADRSGWDTTQLLRIPGWANHKIDYRDKGKVVSFGKLLWTDGQMYLPGDFSELPDVQGMQGEGVTDALELEIEGIDRHKALARVRLKLTRRVRDLLSARAAAGDRSDALWEIERSLADAGCSVAEIVAIVRETVWNKYTDRADEMRRLILEASKAISAKPDKTEEGEDLDVERPDPQRFGNLLRNVKRPKFLVDGILTEGACGFIAGEPKCYKSWVGLDLALSVATGANFLDHFRVVNPGPVFYIQEEDPLPTLKERTGKVWAGKGTDKLRVEPSDGFPELLWLPPEANQAFDPDISAYVQHGVIISDEAWQLWLDDQLALGMDGEPYRLLIIDTLMMTAGDVDENKSQQMTQQIYRPLKVLARKHNVALMVIHHMGKSEKHRAGQRMLGGVANHAWSEDSLYLGRTAGGEVKMELESKTAPSATYRVGNLDNRVWEPAITNWRDEDKDKPQLADVKVEGHEVAASPKPRGRKEAVPNLPRTPSMLALKRLGRPATTNDIANDKQVIISRAQIWRQLRKAEDAGLVSRVNKEGTDWWTTV